MFDGERFDRRTVLKGLGGAAAVGAVGTAAFATSGAASASLDVDIGGSEYSGDEGLVDYFQVNATKVLEWDGFDEPVRYFGIKHEITLENDTIDGDVGWHTVYDDMTGRLTDWSAKDDYEGWGGDGEYIDSHGGDKDDYLKGRAVMDITWKIISDTDPSVFDPVDWTDKLSVAADGETKKRVLRWKTTITFYTENADGNPVEISDDDGVNQINGTDRIGITVTNEPGEIGGGTDGTSETA